MDLGSLASLRFFNPELLLTAGTLLLVLIDPDNEFPRLCQVLGQPELAASELFATNEGRAENAAALHAILASQFETRDLAEWRSLFRRSDIKFAPLPRLDDVVQDPQLRAANAEIDLHYPGVGRLETVNSPVFVSGVEKRKPTPAPEVGAHTREVLEQLGYSRDQIESIIRNAGQR
jgi:crotonobetainyl-CoA:carnitine CoA-transferase CaiB-like acyl-CoA transferase